MFKNLRKFRAAFLDSKPWKPYVPLALGELTLIVISVFLALQMENWFAERKETRELKEYLGNLSQSIEGDLLSVTRFRDNASELAIASKQTYRKIESDSLDDSTDLDRATFVLRDVLWVNSEFIVNTSAFDAIKNSGFLNQLNGRDLEKLIYEYYLTAEKIRNDVAVYEAATNSLGEQLTLKYIDEGFVTFLGNYRGTSPELIDRILNDPLTLSILYHTTTRIDGIETLILQGRVLREMIAKDLQDFGPEEAAALEILDDYGDTLGSPHVFVAGILNASLSFVGRSSSGYEFFDIRNDELKVRYPQGESWGAMWAYVDMGSWAERDARDYSRFNEIVIEMKGETGTEQVYLSLKDDTDPDDGSESRVEVNLTADWKAYTFPLQESFPTADLTRIHLPFTLVFLGDQAQTVMVRKVQYR
ncbi:MAG: hypothetical protein AAF574_12185 [Pseudomonadota bacterium]